MPDDLSSIEGLADKHRRVLARHHVTDLRGLVQSDRHMIHRAMANLRPRPTLQLISRWQDDARGQLEVAVTDASDWHTAASFVVIFSQRQREGTWERRVEMERTEVEPERHPQVRPGWDCAPVCTWMTSQLSQPDRTAVRSSGEPAPAAKPPQLRIDSAAIIDADGRTDVVTAGRSATDPRTSSYLRGPGPRRAGPRGGHQLPSIASRRSRAGRSAGAGLAPARPRAVNQ